MQLFIRAQSLHAIEVSGTETIAQIKAQVAALAGVPPEEQVLLLAGTPLDDDTVLGHNPLPEFTTLELSTRLLGVLLGHNEPTSPLTTPFSFSPRRKVHGSLARAGKVRGQTPKVAKQEKKKKKTGRAKRRMQYNRRFVNVVPGFGKKKGPNANS
ncbi:ubiquitin-like FUBI-ribosomal protein eS30 fusion protein [Podargus strigoides]